MSDKIYREVTSKIYRGQRYLWRGRRPYTRRDGTRTELDIWSSQCATCEEEFECFTPGTATVFQPNRRCERHHRPGVSPRQAKQRNQNAKAK